jgi:hypothetical protein
MICSSATRLVGAASARMRRSSAGDVVRSPDLTTSRSREESAGSTMVRFARRDQNGASDRVYVNGLALTPGRPHCRLPIDLERNRSKWVDIALREHWRKA